MKHLEVLRDNGAVFTLITIRAIMIAMISDLAPEIFNHWAKDGSQFQCSDTFVWCWLHNSLHWSEWCTTRAAQKTPTNWEDLCERASLRLAYTIKEEDIPSALYVNSNQIQVVYAQGSNLTWAKTGAKQVSTVGNDEKRAFTVMVSIANDGTMLPLQAIYQGYSKVSRPSPSAPNYENCMNAGFHFEYSDMKTYWSTHGTTHSLVDEIIAPYFEQRKKELGLPQTQKSVWQIDVWSVHRSEEFQTWMKNNHPTIVLNFIPGGCTGLFQPCDVRIQRVFKHSLKCSYHSDIVQELSEQLACKESRLVVDKWIGILWDHSVTWLWDAFTTVNKSDIVKKMSKWFSWVTTDSRQMN